MPRAQLLIEGFGADELLEMATEGPLLPLFAGKPVAVTYRGSTLLGGVRRRGSRLTVEVAALTAGAERALKPLEALVKKIALLRGVRELEWRLPNQRARVVKL